MQSIVGATRVQLASSSTAEATTPTMPGWSQAGLGGAARAAGWDAMASLVLPQLAELLRAEFGTGGPLHEAISAVVREDPEAARAGGGVEDDPVRAVRAARACAAVRGQLVPPLGTALATLDALSSALELAVKGRQRARSSLLASVADNVENAAIAICLVGVAVVCSRSWIWSSPLESPRDVPRGAMRFLLRAVIDADEWRSAWGQAVDDASALVDLSQWMSLPERAAGWIAETWETACRLGRSPSVAHALVEWVSESTAEARAELEDAVRFSVQLWVEVVGVGAAIGSAGFAIATLGNLGEDQLASPQHRLAAALFGRWAGTVVGPPALWSEAPAPWTEPAPGEGDESERALCTAPSGLTVSAEAWKRSMSATLAANSTSVRHGFSPCLDAWLAAVGDAGDGLAQWLEAVRLRGRDALDSLFHAPEVAWLLGPKEAPPQPPGLSACAAALTGVSAALSVADHDPHAAVELAMERWSRRHETVTARCAESAAARDAAAAAAARDGTLGVAAAASQLFCSGLRRRSAWWRRFHESPVSRAASLARDAGPLSSSWKVVLWWWRAWLGHKGALWLWPSLGDTGESDACAFAADACLAVADERSLLRHDDIAADCEAQVAAGLGGGALAQECAVLLGRGIVPSPVVYGALQWTCTGLRVAKETASFVSTSAGILPDLLAGAAALFGALDQVSRAD